MRASGNRGAHFFVFITGSAVMATEMCASRFIAPWFGTSMIVWSVLIAVVLAAMSVGYWLGGRLADRRPSWAVLCWIPAIAGVLIALIPPLGGLLFSRLSAGIMATPVNIIILAFVGVVAVFVPPVLLLAMVSPFMVRLIARPTTPAEPQAHFTLSQRWAASPEPSSPHLSPFPFWAPGRLCSSFRECSYCWESSD